MTEMERHHSGGFSLIEVLVAVVLMFLTASSVLGLLSFHKSANARVSERLWLHNRALALSEELPYILMKMDEKFPSLEEEETTKTYEGTTDDIKWKARLQRATVTGLPPFYQLRVRVFEGDQEVNLIRYLLPGRGGGR